MFEKSVLDSEVATVQLDSLADSLANRRERRMNMASKPQPTKPIQTVVRLSQADVPSMELEKASRLARSIWDNFAGRSAKPMQLAEALDVKPSSGGWRELCGASIAYGLTDGGYNATEIKLTDLGRRVVAPKDEGDDVVATRLAALTPRVCREFFTRYDGMKFPNEKVAISVLVDMGVPKERAERCLTIFRANGQFARVLRTIKGEQYVALDVPASELSPSSTPEEADPETGTFDLPEAKLPKTPPAEVVQLGNSKPRQIFVAHGKKTEPLKAIKEVLDKFKVPYVVAVDEPHGGRPISEKVAQLMKDCAAGIFIFTPDETFTLDSGEKIYRPSENVVFELGAGNVLWGKKIVILKEKTVTFASDYRDIGYIEFSMDGIKSTASELLAELIELDFVRLQVG